MNYLIGVFLSSIAVISASVRPSLPESQLLYSNLEANDVHELFYEARIKEINSNYDVLQYGTNGEKNFNKRVKRATHMVMCSEYKNTMKTTESCRRLCYDSFADIDYSNYFLKSKRCECCAYLQQLR